MPEPRAPDDEIREHLVVLRAQVGDERAFERLFERHHAPMLYYLRRLLGSVSDAEDVLQEVWLIVHRKLGDLERPAAFRAWAYRIARHRALARSRAQRRALELEAAAEHVGPGEADGADDLPGDDLAAVHAALQRLSALHREVLSLRFLAELSYDEIAAVVGCSPGTVRSRIHYGRQALREQLTAPPIKRKDTGT